MYMWCIMYKLSCVVYGDTWFTAVEVIAAIAVTAVKVPLKCD